MHLLVGLGNPGSDYARNRHNIGFMAADAIHARYRLSPFRRKFSGLLAEGAVAGARVLLFKPQTYMNESGRAVGAALRFYKLSPGDVTVLHDEIDLAPGKVRVKTGGGAAGHNGIRSVAAHIGPDFRRVRVGVGHPGGKDRVAGHVLDDFSKADAGWVETLLDALAREVPRLLDGNEADFMTRVAEALRPPEKAAPPSQGEGGGDG